GIRMVLSRLLGLGFSDLQLMLPMMGLLSHCILVTHDSSEMFLSQREYATEVLEHTHMVGCNSIRTPADPKSKLGDRGHPVLDLML
nr:ribonuclease H-like domain-containing protein [Tanacetum cinerariifolium]